MLEKVEARCGSYKDGDGVGRVEVFVVFVQCALFSALGGTFYFLHVDYANSGQPGMVMSIARTPPCTWSSLGWYME